MVATVNAQATQAGLDAFKRGGNAVDAAIASALMLGVVDGYNSGIGGGCFVLIRTPDGQSIALDGREMAPAKADRDFYKSNGKVNSEWAQLGPKAIGVPGAVKAYEESVTSFGKLTFAQLLEPAAKVAEEGFLVTDSYHQRLVSTAERLRQFPATAKILLNNTQQPWPVGTRLKQQDLANTYRKLATHGSRWFYQGEFAQRTSEWILQNEGVVTVDDFAKYHTKRRTPVRSTYRGYEIVGFPPPSSGGVHVAQILNILENFDLTELYQKNPSTFYHVIAEAMKLAFADRAYWLGDPDFVDVPLGLIEKSYAKQLAARIDLNQTGKVLSHGTPPNPDGPFFERHTTHVTAVDREGYWVAITTTVNTTFGSKVIVPGLGVVMNNQMDDFSIAPGTENSFGLVGAENNSIAPGKRPLSSMSPTLVLKDGQPIFTAGAAGGPKIITEVVLAIINHLDLELPVGESIGRSRIHHQWSPDKLRVEKNLPQSIQRQLERKGHRLNRSNVVGYCQAISFDPKTGWFEGASDPRINGLAAGE